MIEQGVLHSDYRRLGAVAFPTYSGIQKYMQEIDLSNITLPDELAGYLPTVKKMCAAHKATVGKAFVTIDEKVVKAGMSQRRPGPHVDGCFIPDLNYWGHGGGWNHTCNNLPIPRMSVVVAASVVGCRVWRGTFKGEPQNDGDLSHIREQLDEGELVPAGVGFQLSPDCVHESLPLNTDTQRQFLRIALPVEVGCNYDA